jgi:hypothetical protein
VLEAFSHGDGYGQGYGEMPRGIREEGGLMRYLQIGLLTYAVVSLILIAVWFVDEFFL